MISMSDPIIKQSTLGGTLCGMFGVIVWAELGNTIVLSIVGTTVSFLISHLLRYVVNQKKKKA
jgi:hypothetical protein